MKNRCGVKQLSLACRRGAIQSILDKYVRACRSAEDSSAPQKKGAHPDRFPNLAGFCRFVGVTPQELDELAEEYPEEISGLFTALEDEALNSALPAAILSVYLKKRLGYEEGRTESAPAPIQICFEHDVMRDGE